MVVPSCLESAGLCSPPPRTRHGAILIRSRGEDALIKVQAARKTLRIRVHEAVVWVSDLYRMTIYRHNNSGSGALPWICANESHP